MKLINLLTSVICSFIIIFTLVGKANAEDIEWDAEWYANTEVNDNGLTLAAKQSNEGKDIIAFITFSTRNNCNSTFQLALLNTPINEKSLGEETPTIDGSDYQMRVDKNTTWSVETAKVYNANGHGYLSVGISHELVKQIMLGNTLRFKLADKYISFSLSNSTKAITKALNLCAKHEDSNEDYFTPEKKVKKNPNAAYFEI